MGLSWGHTPHCIWQHPNQSIPKQIKKPGERDNERYKQTRTHLQQNFLSYFSFEREMKACTFPQTCIAMAMDKVRIKLYGYGPNYNLLIRNVQLVYLQLLQIGLDNLLK